MNCSTLFDDKEFWENRFKDFEAKIDNLEKLLDDSLDKEDSIQNIDRKLFVPGSIWEIRNDFYPGKFLAYYVYTDDEGTNWFSVFNKIQDDNLVTSLIPPRLIDTGKVNIDNFPPPTDIIIYLYLSNNQFSDYVLNYRNQLFYSETSNLLTKIESYIHSADTDLSNFEYWRVSGSLADMAMEDY